MASADRLHPRVYGILAGGCGPGQEQYNPRYANAFSVRKHTIALLIGKVVRFWLAEPKTNNRSNVRYHAAAGKVAFETATAYLL